VKHLTPIQFDVGLGDGFVVEFSGNGDGEIEDAKVSEDVKVSDQPQEIYDGRIDPNSVKSVPTSFIREFVPTEGCNTCKRKNFHGYVHSKKCLQRYRNYLKEQDAKLNPQVADRPAEQPIGASEPLVELPIPQGDSLVAGGDEQQFPQLSREDMPVDDDIDPSIAPDEGLDIGVADFADSGVGMDVNLPTMPAVVETEDAEMPERMVIDPLLETPMHEFDPVTLDKVRDNVIGLTHSVYFKKDGSSRFEHVDLCGQTVLMYQPEWIISDVTGVLWTLLNSIYDCATSWKAIERMGDEATMQAVQHQADFMQVGEQSKD